MVVLEIVNLCPWDIC